MTHDGSGNADAGDEELGGGMDYYVGSPLDWVTSDWAGKSVVYDELGSFRVSKFAYFFKVYNVVSWVLNTFAIEHSNFFVLSSNLL